MKLVLFGNLRIASTIYRDACLLYLVTIVISIMINIEFQIQPKNTEFRTQQDIDIEPTNQNKTMIFTHTLINQFKLH